MDQIAQSGANRVYQDFEPSFEWTEDEASGTLVLMLPGFTKEQLKVQVTSKPLLRINAERQIDNSTWRRFAKEFPIPSYCNSDEVIAKFERGILSVKLPKIITQEAPIPQLPSAEPKALRKKEKEQVTDGKGQSKTEQEQNKTDQKEQDKTEQEQSKTEQVAPRNEVAHEKEEFVTHKDHEKTKAKKMPQKMKTRVLDFSVSLKSEDAKNGFCGKRKILKWPKRVMNIVVAILMVMVLGMYVKNAFRSSDQGGSKFQEF